MSKHIIQAEINMYEKLWLTYLNMLSRNNLKYRNYYLLCQMNIYKNKILILERQLNE